MHLTNECVRATLIADRCENYRQATIEEQSQDAGHKWRLAEKRRADRLAKELRGRPEATVPKLQAFGAGMRLMLTCLEELIEDVQSQGYLAQDDLELALCLVGVAPTREKIRRDVLAYAINLFNLGCTPGASATVVAEWLEPENRPDGLQGVAVDEVFGADAGHNRELLVGELEGEVERLRAEADRLAREVDGPRLAAVLDRASIPIDEAARRLTRSHAEARTTYHRASSALWPMLEREKEEGARGVFRRRRRRGRGRGRGRTGHRSCRVGRGGVGSRPPGRRNSTRGCTGFGRAGAGHSGAGQGIPNRTRGFPRRVNTKCS